MNVRESDAAAAILEAAGHTKAEDETSAEIVLVNSCTVRDMAERKGIGKTSTLLARRAGRGRHLAVTPGLPKVVGLMGCAVQRLGEALFKKLPSLDFAVGPRHLGLLPQFIERTLAGEKGLLALSGPDDLPSGLAEHAQFNHQAYVTILVGCDNYCSYCIVPRVRGHEFSRPAREIIAEVRTLAEHGVQEVCLLGQSVLRYGIRNKAWFDDDAPSPAGFKEPFPRLLEALSAIPGIRRIRFTSAHPKGCTDELIEAYVRHGQICRHLHLPVQSGSDRLLKEMGRRYTRAEYLAAVKKLRQFDPTFSVTTDIIVGYPGETDEDFEETRTLMNEAGFDNAFIFKYSPRPGTRSAELPDDVPTAEKERRDQLLLADQEVRGQERNARLIGSLREVLAEGPSLRNKARWSGRDSGNRIVLFTPPHNIKVGDIRHVRIVSARPQTLSGNVENV